MLSPVVLGVKKSVADRFGWTNNPNVTWKDIEAKSADGSFKFAMTNPAASNSGLVALIGVASALSGSSDSIDTGTIDKAALRAFFKGQALTAGSSGFLADSYVREQDGVDGIVNYESILMSLNAGGKLHEPLTLDLPEGRDRHRGLPVHAAQRRQARGLRQGHGLSPDARRPEADHDRHARAGPPSRASRWTRASPSQTLIELPFPAKLETIDALITTYLDEIRRPASAVFVLDVSGSMEGDRLDQLKTAMKALTGTDTSLTGKFARFRAHEEVTIITFSSDVQDVRDFTIDDTAPDGPDMTAIRDYIDGLTRTAARRSTPALEQAYDSRRQAPRPTDPDRLYSIVLMTDGENNAGRRSRPVRQGLRRLPDSGRGGPHLPRPVRRREQGRDDRHRDTDRRLGLRRHRRRRCRRSSSRSADTSEPCAGLEAFLYSRRNIVGSLLALGGLACIFVGLVGGTALAADRRSACT